MKLVCLGEILWDIIEGQPHIGGASFNVAAHARRAGMQVDFISAVANDELGRKACERIAALDLHQRYIRLVDSPPTGTVDVWLTDGQPDFTINRPAAYDFPRLAEDDLAAIAGSGADWLYFGTLAQLSEAMGETRRRLLVALPEAQRFYDVNLRRESYTPALVLELLNDATVLKLNDGEMAEVAAFAGVDGGTIAGFCAAIAERCALAAVVVTRGADGCALWREGEYVEVPGAPATLVDAVGAGDAFSAMCMWGLGQPEWSLAEVGRAANRLGALVASHAGAVPDWTLAELNG